MASRINPLRNILCHCMTFYDSGEPAPCDLPGSQNLDWQAAQSLASIYNLGISFASPQTMSKVLEVERPLSTNVLMSKLEYDGKKLAGNIMMCGEENEARTKYMNDNIGEQLEGPEYDGYVSNVIGVLFLFIILYAIGEYVWPRYSKRCGRIMLKGQERKLTAAQIDSQTITALSLEKGFQLIKPHIEENGR